MRLAASTQDGIKLRLISSNFVFPSSVQFLSDTQRTRQCKKGTRPCLFIDVTAIRQYQTWASCLARAMSTASRSSRLPWIDEGACLLKIHYVGSTLHWQSHYIKFTWQISACVQRALYESGVNYAAVTWQRETRSLRKWPEVSLLMASSRLFPYSGKKEGVAFLGKSIHLHYICILLSHHFFTIHYQSSNKG